MKTHYTDTFKSSERDAIAHQVKNWRGQDWDEKTKEYKTLLPVSQALAKVLKKENNPQLTSLWKSISKHGKKFVGENPKEEITRQRFLDLDAANFTILWRKNQMNLLLSWAKGEFTHLFPKV